MLGEPLKAASNAGSGAGMTTPGDRSAPASPTHDSNESSAFLDDSPANDTAVDRASGNGNASTSAKVTMSSAAHDDLGTLENRSSALQHSFEGSAGGFAAMSGFSRDAAETLLAGMERSVAQQVTYNANALKLRLFALLDLFSNAAEAESSRKALKEFERKQNKGTQEEGAPPFARPLGAQRGQWNAAMVTVGSSAGTPSDAGTTVPSSSVQQLPLVAVDPSARLAATIDTLFRFAFEEVALRYHAVDGPRYTHRTYQSIVSGQVTRRVKTEQALDTAVAGRERAEHAKAWAEGALERQRAHHTDSVKAYYSELLLLRKRVVELQRRLDIRDSIPQFLVPEDADEAAQDRNDEQRMRRDEHQHLQYMHEKTVEECALLGRTLEERDALVAALEEEVLAAREEAATARAEMVRYTEEQEALDKAFLEAGAVHRKALVDSAQRVADLSALLQQRDEALVAAENAVSNATTGGAASSPGAAGTVGSSQSGTFRGDQSIGDPDRAPTPDPGSLHASRSMRKTPDSVGTPGRSSVAARIAGMTRAKTVFSKSSAGIKQSNNEPGVLQSGTSFYNGAPRARSPSIVRALPKAMTPASLQQDATEFMLPLDHPALKEAQAEADRLRGELTENKEELEMVHTARDQAMKEVESLRAQLAAAKAALVDLRERTVTEVASMRRQHEAVEVEAHKERQGLRRRIGDLVDRATTANADAERRLQEMKRLEVSLVDDIMVMHRELDITEGFIAARCTAEEVQQLRLQLSGDVSVAEQGTTFAPRTMQYFAGRTANRGLSLGVGEFQRRMRLQNTLEEEAVVISGGVSPAGLRRGGGGSLLRLPTTHGGGRRSTALATSPKPVSPLDDNGDLATPRSVRSSISAASGVGASPKGTHSSAGGESALPLVTPVFVRSRVTAHMIANLQRQRVELGLPELGSTVTTFAAEAAGDGGVPSPNVLSSRNSVMHMEGTLPAFALALNNNNGNNNSNTFVGSGDSSRQAARLFGDAGGSVGEMAVATPLHSVRTGEILSLGFAGNSPFSEATQCEVEGARMLLQDHMAQRVLSEWVRTTAATRPGGLTTPPAGSRPGSGGVRRPGSGGNRPQAPIGSGAMAALRGSAGSPPNAGNAPAIPRDGSTRRAVASTRRSSGAPAAESLPAVIVDGTPDEAMLPCDENDSFVAAPYAPFDGSVSTGPQLPLFVSRDASASVPNAALASAFRRPESPNGDSMSNRSASAQPRRATPASAESGAAAAAYDPSAAWTHELTAMLRDAHAPVVEAFPGLEFAEEYFDMFQTHAGMRRQLANLVTLCAKEAALDAEIAAPVLAARRSRQPDPEVPARLKDVLHDKFLVFRSLEAHASTFLQRLHRKKDDIMRHRQEDLERVLGTLRNISVTHPKEAAQLTRVAKQSALAQRSRVHAVVERPGLAEAADVPLGETPPATQHRHNQPQQRLQQRRPLTPAATLAPLSVKPSESVVGAAAAFALRPSSGVSLTSRSESR